MFLRYLLIYLFMYIRKKFSDTYVSTDFQLPADSAAAAHHTNHCR